MRLKLGAEWQCCCMILQRFYTSLQSGNQRFSLRPFSMRKFNAILRAPLKIQSSKQD